MFIDKQIQMERLDDSQFEIFALHTPLLDLPYAVFAKSLSGSIVLANDIFCSIVGYSLQSLDVMELKHLKILEIETNVIDTFSPAVGSEVWLALGQSAEAGYFFDCLPWITPHGGLVGTIGLLRGIS